MKIKIPLPAFDRSPNQTPHILKNRYALEVDTKDEHGNMISVLHEALWVDREHTESKRGKWGDGWAWWTLGINKPHRKEHWKDREPDKSYLFGLLKRFEDYYDGPIITWELGPFFINYRW
jgi:hypothetical protein